MINWQAESTKILQQSLIHGIDYLFMASIRKAENGAPGREFGILNIPAPDYSSQLKISCNTVSHAIADFQAQLYERLVLSYGLRLCYTHGFIEFLQKRYAPLKVSNDPNDLNENWVADVSGAYTEFCSKGTIV